MPNPVSPKTIRALKLIEKGMTPYAAAKKAGIASCTIYRAQKRIRLQQEQEAKNEQDQKRHL